MSATQVVVVVVRKSTYLVSLARYDSVARATEHPEQGPGFDCPQAGVDVDVVSLELLVGCRGLRGSIENSLEELVVEPEGQVAQSDRREFATQQALVVLVELEGCVCIELCSSALPIVGLITWTGLGGGDLDGHCRDNQQAAVINWS